MVRSVFNYVFLAVIHQEVNASGLSISFSDVVSRVHCSNTMTLSADAGLPVELERLTVQTQTRE